jgi:hypothetical protein
VLLIAVKGGIASRVSTGLEQSISRIRLRSSHRRAFFLPGRWEEALYVRGWQQSRRVERFATRTLDSILFSRMAIPFCPIPLLARYQCRYQTPGSLGRDDLDENGGF